MCYARAFDREFFTRFSTRGEAGRAILTRLPRQTIRSSIQMDLRRVLVSAGRRVLSAAAGATLVALFTLSREVTATETCDRLRGLSLPDRATVTDARSVASNTKPFFSPRAFCRA